MKLENLKSIIFFTVETVNQSTQTTMDSEEELLYEKIADLPSSYV